MPTVTTSELVDRAKTVSDMRDNFVTPTQWMYWASQERLALDLFLARSGWPQNIAFLDITVTGSEAGSFPVNPSEGVMAILAVHEVVNERVRLLQLEDAVGFYRQTTGSSQGAQTHASRYRLRATGDNLYLDMYPNPAVGETYRVSYIPHSNKLTLTSPPPANHSLAVLYPMGWEERIVLGMARRALIKEESDTRAVDQEIALWDQRIEEACWNRVLSESPAVRNTDSLHYGWTDRYSLPPVGQWAWV